MKGLVITILFVAYGVTTTTTTTTITITITIIIINKDRIMIIIIIIGPCYGIPIYTKQTPTITNPLQHSNTPTLLHQLVLVSVRRCLRTPAFGWSREAGLSVFGIGTTAGSSGIPHAVCDSRDAESMPEKAPISTSACRCLLWWTTRTGTGSVRPRPPCPPSPHSHAPTLSAGCRKSDARLAGGVEPWVMWPTAVGLRRRAATRRAI